MSAEGRTRDCWDCHGKGRVMFFRERNGYVTWEACEMCGGTGTLGRDRVLTRMPKEAPSHPRSLYLRGEPVLENAEHWLRQLVELRAMLRAAHLHGQYYGSANARANLSPAQRDEAADKYVALEPIPAVEAVQRARTVGKP